MTEPKKNALRDIFKLLSSFMADWYGPLVLVILGCIAYYGITRPDTCAERRDFVVVIQR